MENVKKLRDRWKNLEYWADMFRFGAVAILLLSIVIFSILGNEIVRSFIWYWVVGVSTIATIGFVLGIMEGRAAKKYFKASVQRIKDFIGEDK